MCKGNFKEAHERHIVLPDDDPVDVGIMVECLYTRDFWTGANAQMGVSRQDSAIRLANLYTFAEKYDLTTMKDIVAKKIPKYTDIEEPEHWLAVAEIIYAAIPEGDHRYPKILRSLVVRFMNTQTKEKPVVKTGKRTKNTKDALLDWTAKGGRLATDISRGSREYWVRRIRDRDAAIKNKELWHKLRFNESNLDSEGSYDEDIINGTAF